MGIKRKEINLRNNYDDTKAKEAKEMLEKEYPDFESFKKDVYEKIEIGLKQAVDGKYVPARKGFKELEEKYNLWKNTK